LMGPPFRQYEGTTSGEFNVGKPMMTVAGPAVKSDGDVWGF
jgi:hypothetical protein